MARTTAPTTFNPPPHPEAFSFEVPRASLKREVDTLRTFSNPLARLVEWAGNVFLGLSELHRPVLAGVA